MPKLMDDPRISRCWYLARSLGPTFTEPAHLVEAALLLSDEPVCRLIGSSLHPGATLSDLRTQLPALEIEEAIHRGSVVSGSELSAALLETLGEYDQALEGLKLGAIAHALELLIACALPRVSGESRQKFPAIHWDRAVDNFRNHVASIAFASVVGSSLWEGIVKGANEQATATHYRETVPNEGTSARTTGPSFPFEDVTARVSAGDYSIETPFTGDESYELLFDRLGRILSRERTHHVLFVAERGVGHAIALAEFARRVALGAFPSLNGFRVLSANVRHTPRNETAQVLRTALGTIAERPKVVAVLDGLGALLRGEGTTHEAALLSMLAHSRSRLIAVVEPWECEEILSMDIEMLDFFDKVELPEPDQTTAVRLVRRLADGLSQRYECSISDEVVRSAVVLSSNYILNERLPGKALRVLHRLCEDLQFERQQRRSTGEELTEEDVVLVVSEIAGVPAETLRGIAEHVDYRTSLKSCIFGQEHAIAEVATELGLIKAGFSDPGKPASVMLFIGQTGTGKTELAKVLARFYSASKRLKTYTLGNFVEPHSVAGIIGVPPGYVGHDQGGRLINDLNADPYCVFLLDEVDKAHPDVLQPFLNLFDEGWVRDQRGVQARADKAIFILTTNVGQRMIAEMAQQEKGIEEITARMKEAMSQIRHGKSNRPVFTPEFLARIKRIVVFKPLDQIAIEEITRKLLDELQQTWRARRHKVLAVSLSLRKALAEEAHRLNKASDGREGGRIVRKLISDWIEAPVQKAISMQPDQYRLCKSLLVEPTANPEAVKELPGSPKAVVRFD